MPKFMFKTFEPGHEKTCLMSYANSKGADQPAHPCSLISAFVVRCLDSVISLVSVTKISSLMLASVTAGQFESDLVGNSRRHVFSWRHFLSQAIKRTLQHNILLCSQSTLQKHVYTIFKGIFFYIHLIIIQCVDFGSWEWIFRDNLYLIWREEKYFPNNIWH